MEQMGLEDKSGGFLHFLHKGVEINWEEIGYKL